MMHDQLISLGLSPDDLSYFHQSEDMTPARVTIMHGNSAEVIWIPQTECISTLLPLSKNLDMPPVAGDWVGVRKNEISQIAPRRTTLTRPDPAGRDVQVLAANIDLVFIMVPLNQSIVTGSLERLLVMAWDSGSEPLIIFTKADLCEDIDEILYELHSILTGVPYIVTSSRHNLGIATIRDYLSVGKTAVMLGVSGVGKTTLLNALLGTNERTFEIRADGQGRHITTTRRLFLIPEGGAILDIPGIRSLSLLTSDKGVTETFADIMAYAEECKFRDCSHKNDTGCAVVAAVYSGELSQQRFDSWNSIQKELAYQARRNNPAMLAEEKKKWKQLSKNTRKKY